MKQQLSYLIDYLRKEDASEIPVGDNFTSSFEEFRALCNVRKPIKPTTAFLKKQDDFLTEHNTASGYITKEEMKQIDAFTYVWQGDITRLKVDAIVNAANSELLGCREPNHNCIDNLIHTKAGIQLRLACHEVIVAQGRKESIGKAKMTKGYNLPASYVIHTVGPYINERGVTPLKEQLLANSYRNCLKTADEYNLHTIAFCCISTGVFNFPNERAAEIAIETVAKYRQETNSKLQVIYNLFLDKDVIIYDNLLAQSIS